ncbi:MAG: Glutamate racemase [uncultured bacterium]|nr:MAG: Glutamate racemase [uncultured bacterium]
MRNKFIGIFDSGFGGLNILRGILKELPEYDYVYLGDTARVPYGNRSKETIFEFTRQAMDFLFQNDCQLIILACNTASADALRKLQQEYLPENYPDKKILGVIIPTAEEAIFKTKNNKIGVLATEATVKSKAFEREITKLNPGIKIYQNACPLLVPIVESGEHETAIADIVLRKYLQSLLEKNIDTLILGCTHYEAMENKIKEIVGGKIEVISESEIIARKLKNYLARHSEMESKLSKKSKQIIYTTDLTDRFIRLGGEFLGREIAAEKISITKNNL